MGGRQSTPTSRKVFYALAGVGVFAATLWLAWQNAVRQEPPANDTTVYQADKPLSAIPSPLIGGLILLRPEQLVSAPIVDGFQWPCGAPNGAMMYDAQPFGAKNDYRHGYHTGQDINGIGGQNTDLDEPVYAAARGLVVYSGEPSPEWGNVIVLAHRLPGGGIVQTLYAHLNQRAAHVGQYVSRGECIGSIGTAGGRYLAHLHFEAIQSQSAEAGMPGYHPAGTMNRLDPARLLREYPAPAMPDAYEAVRHLRRMENLNQKPGAPAPLPQEPGVIPVSPQQFLTP